MTMRSVCSISDVLSALRNIQPPRPVSWRAVSAVTWAGPTRSCGAALNAKAASITPVTTISAVSSHMISASPKPSASSTAMPMSLPSSDTIQTCVQRSWRWLAPSTALKTCPGICIGTPTMPSVKATRASAVSSARNREELQQPRHRRQGQQRDAAQPDHQHEGGGHGASQRVVVAGGDVRRGELRHRRGEAELQQAHVAAHRADEQPDAGGRLAHLGHGGREQQQVHRQVDGEAHVVPRRVADDRLADT